MMAWLCATLSKAAPPPVTTKIFAFKRPLLASPVCSASITMPAARPSGKGSCSSLMKRRLSGNANSTPKSAMDAAHIIAVVMGMTLPVTIM